MAECIELYEDGYPYLDEVYVRGHVDEEAYLKAIRPYIDGMIEEWDDDDPAADEEAMAERARGYLPTVHTYARWVWDGSAEQRRVLARSPKGRGAFAVTVGVSGAIRRAQEARHAKDAAHREELLTRYPGIEIVSGPPFLRFKAPGLAGVVDASWEPDLRLHCEARDVEAWGRYLAHVRP